MSRRTRWILLVLLVVLVGGVAALVLTQQPKLDDARTRSTPRGSRCAPTTSCRCATRRSPARSARSTPPVAPTATCRRTSTPRSKRWDAALQDGDAGAQATAANDGRGAGHPPRRERARLAAVRRRPGGHRLPGEVRADQAEARRWSTAYNRAVRDYEDVRTGALAQPVAQVLGFDARPVLAIDGRRQLNAGN